MTAPVPVGWRAAVRSLRNRNFRRYAFAQGFSQTGLWAQNVAELWLVYEITGNATALGLQPVFKFGPMLVLGAYVGVISDRIDRRKLLIATQTMHTIVTGVLAAMVWLTAPTVGLVYATVLIQGIVYSFDIPVRSAFLRDLASDDELTNAISLNSTIGTLGRTAGPALAGLLIATIGTEWCFALNSLSFGVVVVALVNIDATLLRRASTTPARGRGQLMAGLSYARRTPVIRRTLLLALVVSMTTWQWMIVLPVYSVDEFGGSAQLYGLLASILSAGSVLGAVYTARLSQPDGRYLRVTAALLAGAVIAAAVAPTLPIAFIAFALIGATGVSFLIGAQSRLQLNVDDAMAGRVMALWAIVFGGSKPIGGAAAGAIVALTGPRATFGIAAAITGLAVLVHLATARSPRKADPEPASLSANAAGLDMQLDDGTVIDYRATMRVSFEDKDED